MKKNKFIYLIIAVLLLSSCGSSSDTASSTESATAETPVYEEDYNLTEEVQGEATSGDSTVVDGEMVSDIKATGYNREAKFAKEGTIESVLEDKKENTPESFDETIVWIEDIVNKYNGYFETANYSDYGGKHFNSTIKVPVKDFQNLFNELKSVGVNIYNESSVLNKTSGYYSLKSQLEVKKLSKERLEELIATTKSTKDLLKLYDSYFDLVAEIETMEANLSQIESTTSYSTIYYSIGDGSNKIYVDDESFTSKIKTGLSASINFIATFFIGLSYISVPLIIATIIGFFGYKKINVLLKKLVKEEVEDKVDLKEEVKEVKEDKEVKDVKEDRENIEDNKE